MAKNTVEIVISAKDQASNVLRGVGGAVNDLGKVAIASGLALGAAVGGIGAALGKLAIDAAPLEGLKKSFEGLAASSGQSADELLAALQKGSAGMISQRDLMMSYNKAAQLISVDVANKLPDAFQYLGKVAAATGTDMGFLLDSMVTGVGRLSPMILDNLAIQVSATEANEAYAKSIGKSASELTKQEQQTAMMNLVLEKLAENTAAMPDVSMNAAAAMAQFKAQIQDAKDQIGLAFLPVMTRLVGVGTELITAVLPFLIRGVETLANVIGAFLSGAPGDFPWEDIFPAKLADMAYKVAGVFETVRNAVSGFFQLASHAIKWGEILDYREIDALTRVSEPVRAAIYKLVEAFLTIVDHKDAIVGAIKALGLAFAKAGLIKTILVVGKLLMSLTNPLTLLMAAIALLGAAWAENWFGIREKAAAAWEFLQPIVEQLVQWFQEFLPRAIATLAQFWTETLQPALMQFWQFIQDSVIPMLTELWAWLGVQIPAAIQMVSDFFNNTLLPAIQAVINWIRENGPQIVEALVGAFNTIMAVVGPIISELASFFQEQLGVIITWVQTNWPLIQEAISDTLGTIQTIVTTILTAIYDFWILHGTQIMDFVRNLWGVIKLIIETAINAVLGIIRAVLFIISGDWEGAWEAIKGVLATIWEAIKGVIEIALDNVKTAVTIAMEELPGIIKSIGSKLMAAGKEIIEQLWEGLKGKMEEVMNWFKDKLSALSDMLPWNSPPRDLSSPLQGLRRAGENIGNELLSGLRVSIPKLQTELAAGLVAPAQGGAAGKSISYGGHTYNMTVNDRLTGALLIDQMERQQRFERIDARM